jgi:GxxExxY protein
MSNSPEASRDPQTYAIIGAAMEVHRILGSHYLEAVYQDALEVEFIERGIPYVREAALHVHYKGRTLPSTFRADYLCYEAIVVELKALRTLTLHEDAQVLNYLATAGFKRALALNFATPRLTYQRYVRGADSC